MNPATIIFGYAATVQAPAASFAMLSKTWTTSLKEHNSPYFYDEKHAVVTAPPMVALADKVFEFRAVFGVEIDWHDWPEVSGYTVGRSSHTGISNICNDIDALPTGRKLLERSINKAGKLKKKKSALKPVELSFESPEPRAYLVGPGTARVRLIVGCRVDDPPPTLPWGVAAHGSGDTAIVGFELATLEAGQRLLNIDIEPEELSVFGKSEQECTDELSSALGETFDADSSGLYLVSTSLEPRSLHLHKSMTTGATAPPPPDFSFEPEESATAFLYAGRRFDHVTLSAEQGALLEGLLERISAAGELMLWWQVAGDASALSEQLDSEGTMDIGELPLVIGSAVAFAECDLPSSGVTVGEVRAALERLGDQVPPERWADVERIVTGKEPVAPSADNELLLFATGPLASAYLVAGSLATSETALKDPELELISGNTMAQSPQPCAVLGKPLAGIQHDDSLTPLQPVTTAILDLEDDTTLHLVASYDQAR